MSDNELSRIKSKIPPGSALQSTSTFNKQYVLEARKQMKHRDFNPIDQLIQLCRTSEDEDIQFKCLKTLLNYYVPAMKSQDLNDDLKNTNSPITVQVINYEESAVTKSQSLVIEPEKVKKVLSTNTEVEITDYE